MLEQGVRVMSSEENPYKFTVKGTTFDFYDLSDAIQFQQSAVEHAVKKLVALGIRSGKKSYDQDLHEAIMSLLRAQQQRQENDNESLQRFLRAGSDTQGVHPQEQQDLLMQDSLEDAVLYSFNLLHGNVNLLPPKS